MKLFKKLVFVLLAVCMAFSSFAFTACTENDNPPPDTPIVDLGNPEKDGYQITLKYPDGTAVKGSDTESSRIKVSIVLLDDNGNRLNAPNDGILDEYGVARINYKTPGEYTVSIINMPAGYVYTPIKTSETVSKHEITLAHLYTEYPVSLTYTDGSPAANIPVKFMDGDTEVASLTTDANGKANSAVIVAGIYSVILDIPEGMGYLPFTTTMRVDTVEAEIFDINAITFEDKDKLDEEGMNKWDDKLNSSIVSPFEMQADYFEFTAHATKEHPAYYAIHADKRGTYNFHVWSDTSKNYRVEFYGMNFDAVHSDLALYTGGNPNRPLDLDADNVYYFAVTTTDDECDLTFAVSLPIPSPVTVEWRRELGIKDITFEMNEAIIHFIPSEAGIYEVVSTSNYDTILYEYGSNNQPIEGGQNPNYYDDDSGEGLNFKYTTTITSSYIGGTFIYRIRIKDENVEYPTTIQVSIRRVGNAPDEKQFIERNVSTNQNVKYDNQQGTFTWMPVDGSLQTYQKSDGIWYVQLADGTERPLVIAITKDIRTISYSFATVEYQGSDDIAPIKPGEEDKDDTTEPTLKNAMLTVAENLEEYLDPTLPSATVLNYRGFIETYKNLVNKDGVYELNGELKTFAERYMNQRGRDISNYISLDVAEGCMWLLCCGYYA